MLSLARAREIFGGVREEWDVIRERTQGVVNGYYSGFYLWGSGGIGKSYQVLNVCKGVDKLVHLNTRLTAAGFFDQLCKFPDHLFVIEDVETVFDDKKSWGLLRSALWGQKDSKGIERRLVSWTIADNTEKEDHRSGHRAVNFTGRIIIIANTRLADRPEIKALADRIPTYELCLTGEQIRAAMIMLSERNWKHGEKVVAPKECKMVTRFLLEQIDKHTMTVSLRLRELALKPYLAWREGDTGMDWKKSVTILVEQSAARQEVDRVDKKIPQRQRIAAQEQVIREIRNTTSVWKEQVSLWKKMTGASRATMYRRMAGMGL